MTLARQGTVIKYSGFPYRQPWSILQHLGLGASRDGSTRSSFLLKANEDEAAEPKEAGREEERQGAMTERLSQMTEESIGQGSRNIKQAVNEGGFSEILKKQMEARIQDSTFKSQNPTAFAELNMPVGLT